MSDVRRLSEMIGLERTRSTNESVWPTNVALGCLGGGILWLAFRFLKWDDPRPLYNPWLYALVTPLSLLALSLILRRFVSRVVERSAQVAFLVSVMVHLGLLVWALDVVIYKNRMWPTFFETLAQQKEDLIQRDRSTRKYFNLTASASPKAKRPEYLRYVPTEHDASESELSDQTRLQLARSEKAEMLSPDPQPKPTVEPFLIERPQPAQAMSIKMEAPTELSRAELHKPTPARTEAESMEALRVDTPAPELWAAEADSSRARTGDSNLPPTAHAPAEPLALGASASPLGVPQSIARNIAEPSLAAAAAAQLRDRADYRGATAAPRPADVPVPETSGSRPDGTTALGPSVAAAGGRARRTESGAAGDMRALEPSVVPGGVPGAGLGNIARSDLADARGSLDGQLRGAGLDRGSLSLPRGELGGASGPPGTGRIDVPASPDNGSATQGGSGPSIAPSTQAGSRRSSGSPERGQLSLEIEASPGLGGISLEPGRGPLIARSSPSSADIELPSLDIGRFSLDDVGGPLSGGVAGPVPTPAFQQRIDRLKDDAGGDPGPTGPQTELAIERGLQFLSRHQRPDGSWRLQDLDKDVLIHSDTAATGLCLLAYQGAGYTHQQYKYATINDKALRFLIQHQRANGDLYIPQDPASDQNAWLYSHGIATLALCEAYGMTQDPQLRPAAQLAVNFMVNSQEPLRGGWRYRPGVGSDTSVTGWFMMALKSAQLAGLEVPKVTFDRMAGYVQASQVSAAQPHLFRYNPFAPDTVEQRHGLQPTHVMTSVGLLMRLYLGWRRDLPEM